MKRIKRYHTTDLKRYETKRILNAKGSVHVTSIYSAWGMDDAKITGISRVMTITNKSFRTAYKNAIIHGAHIYLNRGREPKNWISGSGKDADKSFGFRYKVRSWIINYYSHKEQAVTHFDNIRWKKKNYSNANFVYYNDKLIRIVEEDKASLNRTRIKKQLINRYGNVEDIEHTESSENYARMFKQ